jgi:hypothetical protein
MLLSVLADSLVVAAEVAEEESEPVAFYICGGIAAVWAIILFVVGMRSPTFPGSPAAARVVGLISVLVVAAAMASAVLSS